MDVNNNIFIWNLFRRNRDYISSFKESEVKKIEVLVKENLITKEKTIPKYCNINDCQNQLETIEENDEEIILRDEVNPNHIIRIPIGKAYIYELNDNFYKYLLDNVISEIKNINKIQYFDGYYLTTEDNSKIAVLFLNEVISNKNKIILLLFKISIENTPTILFYNKFVDRKNIYSIVKGFPFGYLCVPISLSPDYDYENIKNRISKFITINNKIKEIQEQIIKSIGNDKSKELIKDIVTNPQYLLNIINRVSMNEKDEKNDYTWRDFENLIRAIFSIIYHSRMDFGGINQPGEEIGDSYFFVVDQEIDSKKPQAKIIGIVDSKFSFQMDLSKEKTEKYLKYIDDLRNSLIFPYKIPLIFIYLDESSKKNTYEFIDRLVPSIKDKDTYVVTMSLNSIMILAHFYLSISLDLIKVSKMVDNWSLFKNVFNNEFLTVNRFDTKTNSNVNFYDIDESKLLDLIENYADTRDGIVQKYFDLIN